MKTYKILTLAAATLLAPIAFANLKVVTTTADLASIVKSIGGNTVSVSSLITGARDAHRIEAKPSYMSRVAGADMFVAIGLELEVGYERAILDGASNRKVVIGGRGHVYASDFAYVLEKPTGAVNRSMGDIHPYGNPHVWLDPWNGRLIAIGLAGKMAALDPGSAAVYKANLKKFLDRLDSAMFGAALVEKFAAAKLWQWHNTNVLEAKLAEEGAAKSLGGWLEKMASLSGTPIITYHRSLTYLANRFHLKVIGELEPKPGLDPTPGHLAQVIRTGSDARAKAIVQEPFFSTRHAELVASRIGAKVVVIPQNVGQAPGANDYISMFNVIIDRLSAGLR